jgi:formate/nitrite transporter
MDGNDTVKPNPTGIDAYRPAEIAGLVEAAGVAKARLGLAQMFTLAVLAGAFIGFGAAFYTMVMTGADFGYGPARLVGGVAFCLGLILVIVGGAELFTGNALMVMAAVDRRITAGELARNWAIVWCGNLAGAAGLAIAFALAGFGEGASGQTAVRIAEAKAALGALETFWRAVLCNALVCLAVWLTLAARDVTGKILAIIWPIAGFVTLGLEHCVANMFLLPQGLLAGAQIGFDAVAANLAISTLGNIAGGAGGVALAYRFAYGAPARG